MNLKTVEIHLKYNLKRGFRVVKKFQKRLCVYFENLQKRLWEFEIGWNFLNKMNEFEVGEKHLSQNSLIIKFKFILKSFHSLRFQMHIMLSVLIPFPPMYRRTYLLYSYPFIDYIYGEPLQCPFDSSNYFQPFLD